MNEASTKPSAPDGVVRWLLTYGCISYALICYISAFHDQPRVLYGMLCLVAGAFIGCFVHECGHALAALLCGWRVILFAVRPFALQIPNRDLILVANRYKEDAGGWVASVPRSPEADGKLAWALIVAAGPLASFLLAGLALYGAIGPDLPTSMYNRVLENHLSLGLAVTAFTQGTLSLMNAKGSTPSDGQQLRALRRNETFDKYRPVVWIEGLVRNNVRLRDVPDWMLEEARMWFGQVHGLEQYVAATEIGRLLDNPPFDIAAVRALIEEYRQLYGTTDWLASCDAYLAVMWEEDPESAERALGEVSEASNVRALTLAAQASLAAWLGDAGTVGAKLAEMRTALLINSPFRDLTFRDIEAQIKALLARRSAAPSPARP